MAQVFSVGRWLAKLPLALGTVIWSGIGGAIGLWVTVITSGSVKWWWGALSGFCVALLVRNHTLELRVREFEDRSHVDDSPKIVFDRARCSKTVTLGGWQAKVSQLWFRNSPEKRGDNSTVRDLMARIEFCDSQWHVTKEIIGQWAITRMPEHVGWIEMQSKLDLPPGLEWGKLLLTAEPEMRVERRMGETPPRVDATLYALSGENLFHQPTGDHPWYYLDDTTSRVRVRLSGANMEDREFQFKLELAPNGGVASIVPIQP